MKFLIKTFTRAPFFLRNALTSFAVVAAVIKKAGYEKRAFVYHKNLWKQDLKNFDSVVFFGMKHMMKKLEYKFEKELKPGTKVVSKYFMLPTWEVDVAVDDVYLYIKK